MIDVCCLLFRVCVIVVCCVVVVLTVVVWCCLFLSFFLYVFVLVGSFVVVAC